MAPDPAALREPLFFTPDDGAAPFWIFPSSWDPKAVQAFQALAAELAHEDARVAELRAEADAAAASPEAMLEQKRAELAERRAEREKAEREKAEADVFAELKKKHRRLGRVQTVEGAMFLRPMAEKEIDDGHARMGAPGLSDADKMKLAKSAVMKTIVHPSRDHAAQILEEFPGLWGAVFEERDTLINGLAEERKGKG